jgi:hypothetical protein
MKPFTVLLLSLLLTIGLVGGALAQSSAPAPGAPGPGSTTSNPETKADNPTDRRSDPAPAPSAERGDQPGVTAPGPDVKVDIKSQPGDEDSAALPRATESRRIFGLSPTAFVLLVAGLFVIVILALVSMGGGSRSGTHVDADRRP